MIQTTTICPACGDHIELSDQGRWYATCLNRCATGLGETPEDALTAWGQDASDIRAAAVSSLATFIVPEPPEGYGLTVADERHTEIVDCLSEAEGYAAVLAGRGPLPIYYGPRGGQKAANQ